MVSGAMVGYMLNFLKSKGSNPVVCIFIYEEEDWRVKIGLKVQLSFKSSWNPYWFYIWRYRGYTSH